MPTFGRLAAMVSIKVDLISPLPPQECRRRLDGAIGMPVPALGNRAVRERIVSDSFRLRQRIGYRNSFQTQVIGHLQAEENGTRISCRFGVARGVLAFFAVWIGLVLVVGGAGFLIAAKALLAGSAGAPSAAAGIPLIMLVFGIVLFAFGRWLARNEQNFLTDFLCVTLQAEVVAAP